MKEIPTLKEAIQDVYRKVVPYLKVPEKATDGTVKQVAKELDVNSRTIRRWKKEESESFLEDAIKSKSIIDGKHVSLKVYDTYKQIDKLKQRINNENLGEDAIDALLESDETLSIEEKLVAKAIDIGTHTDSNLKGKRDFKMHYFHIIMDQCTEQGKLQLPKQTLAKKMSELSGMKENYIRRYILPELIKEEEDKLLKKPLEKPQKRKKSK